MKNFSEKELARFEERVTKKGHCWEWNGPLDKDGYGTFFFRSASRRAHRVAWYGVNGEIPSGHVINHTCRNRCCVNPQHLQCLSVDDHHMKDTNSLAYINSQKTHCPNGHPYDKVVTWAGRTQRICTVCDREARKKASKERYRRGKEALSV